MNNLTKGLLGVTALIGAAIGTTWVVTKSTSKQKAKPIKPFFNGVAPYVFAHRGGMKLAPEHTMAAFKLANEHNVDGFEVDVRLTKDEQIVVFHDAFVDRTSNGAGRISNHTLEELRELDFGYHFKDVNGEHPYRGQDDAKILTLEELLNAFPEMRINIDMKDDPETYEGSLIPSVLYRLINKLDAKDRVCVTSFNDAQIERFSLYVEDDIALGAGQSEVTKAFMLYNSGFGHLYIPKANTFQMPVKANGLSLATEGFIKFLHGLNVATGYYVVNNLDEMDDLIQKGAHTIVTDRPDIAQHLLTQRY